jgi:nicotinamidase-related amidase
MRLAAAAIALPLAAQVAVPLRSRVELFKGSDQWHEVRVERAIDAKRSALILCDLWDKHWCRGASERVDAMIPRAAPFVEAAREQGILVIHAPSDTMDFYKDHAARMSALRLDRVSTPAPLLLQSPALPIDDSAGGCDTPDKSYKAWSRQHPGIRIDPARDLVTDKGDDVYTALKLRGIQTLLVMGVHTNMCILNRTFAIKQMTKWGVPCILVRDLTDSMYDPKASPHVTHDQGTELVVQHIEKYWAPTVLSTDLLRAWSKR